MSGMDDGGAATGRVLPNGNYLCLPHGHIPNLYGWSVEAPLLQNRVVKVQHLHSFACHWDLT